MQAASAPPRVVVFRFHAGCSSKLSSGKSAARFQLKCGCAWCVGQAQVVGQVSLDFAGGRSYVNSLDFSDDEVASHRQRRLGQDNQDMGRNSTSELFDRGS